MLKLTLIPLLIIAIQAKVDPPNYNFSLEKLAPFAPESSFEEIKTLYPKYEKVTLKGGVQAFKVYVEHDRYRFPLYFQVSGDSVTNYYARLPQYFLLNIFHQTLFVKYGLQDTFKKLDEHAVYLWKNAEGRRILMVGECTITCFPNFIAEYKSLNSAPLVSVFAD